VVTQAVVMQAVVTQAVVTQVVVTQVVVTQAVVTQVVVTQVVTQAFHHRVGPAAHRRYCRPIPAHHHLQNRPVYRAHGSPGQSCRYPPTADL
jgi:hypothetical protein